MIWKRNIPKNSEFMEFVWGKEREEVPKKDNNDDCYNDDGNKGQKETLKLNLNTIAIPSNGPKEYSFVKGREI